GVILFEMLTGRLPYTGDTPLAVALKHAQEPVPNPRAVNPSVPQALAGITMKAMAKDPAERYPSALALLRDLRRAQECIRLGKSLKWSPAPAAPKEEEEAVEERDRNPRAARGDAWRSIMVALLVITALLGLGLLAFLFTGLGLPKDVTVPPIVGKPRAQAEAMLAEVNLKLKVVEERYSPDPPGTILFATPEPGRQLKEGREIRVAVSRGPEQTTVPDVVHATLSAAERALRGAGLEVGPLRTMFDDVEPKGHVLAQDPAPGETVPKGTRVTLTISKGPELAPGTPVVTPDDQAGVAPPPAPPPPMPQRWEIRVEVPRDGGEQPVRIVVVQDGRENEVYNAPHPAGDRFTHTVETTGRATIRVYVGDHLEREQEVGQ
ncbi:MAG: PASTA domain-containing protein, partial [Armatimonadota bacterium]|nr:PASTA domain-containing protein [Armatimonadota bacterium]